MNLQVDALPKDWRKMIGIIFGAFALGGVFGYVYETLFYLINDGMLVSRGNCYGPFVQIYGYGGLLLFALCWRLRKKPWLVFLVSGLASGLVELVVGWLMYTLGNGFRSWDYNTEIWNWGNIGGFVCLRSVLVFALAGMMLVYMIVPMLVKLSEKLSLRAFLLLTCIPGGIALADCMYNDIIINIFPLRGAIAFFRDSGWFGKVYGVESLKPGI